MFTRSDRQAAAKRAAEQAETKTTPPTDDLETTETEAEASAESLEAAAQTIRARRRAL